MALYADLFEIIAPGQAQAGSRVDITVKVRNTYQSEIGIQVVGVPEYTGLPSGLYIDFPDPVANVGGGAVQSFAGSFTMPNQRVTIHMYSYWYGADDNWYFDDEMTALVELAAAPQPAVSEFRIVDYYKV